MRYLKGTKDYAINYNGEGTDWCGYSDASYADDRSNRRSTAGYVFCLSSGAVSWCSKQQSVVALSTTEAEYIALTQAAKEAMWLRTLQRDLYPLTLNSGPMLIYEDNQGAIALTNNPSFHERSKHIDVRYHYIRELVQANAICLDYCQTDQMIADALTKPLRHDKLWLFAQMMGVHPY